MSRHMSRQGAGVGAGPAGLSAAIELADAGGDVVVLDEPFASVDAITRAELQELAFEVLQDRTRLLITHDPLEALRVGHAVFVLSEVPASRLTPVPVEGTPLREIDSPAGARAHGELLRQIAGTEG